MFRLEKRLLTLYSNTFVPSFLHAKRSAVASRQRCDLSRERSVFCQPQGVGHRNSRVLADLLSPGGRRSASGTPPVGTWPDTVLCFATGPEDPICWYIVSKPGNMTEQSETSFANDGRSCQQTSATQNFVVGYVVVPSDVEDQPECPGVKNYK